MTEPAAFAQTKKRFLELQKAWRTALQQTAQSGRFLDAAQVALQLEANPQELLELNQKFILGEFNDLPNIELLNGSAIGSASGAYASSSRTIYINQSWLAKQRRRFVKFTGGDPGGPAEDDARPGRIHESGGCCHDVC